MSQPDAPSRELRKSLFRHDATLIGIMAVLAACGLIYEYLFAHYAGRVLGAVETTIYAMIGLMIVAMGVGAFTAKWIRCAFSGFAWLEVGIGVIGCAAVLIMAGTVALTYTLPVWLQDVYGLHPSITTDGGVVEGLQRSAEFLPFILGFVLALMVGMEIPLIARIRETLHNRHLEHNTGTIYGADYIGAGIGAAVWILVCIKLPIIVAAVSTAAVNAVIGIIFLWRYRSNIPRTGWLWATHGALGILLVTFALNGTQWMESMGHTLFKDKVVYTKITPYQHLAITERHLGRGLPKVTSLYINGRLQFSSNDEQVYHSLLTYPAMLASARHNNVLVIGGGDGLAVRDILRWQPERVTLIDLDGDMIGLFRGDDDMAPAAVTEKLLEINEQAFQDGRVNVILGDAFIEVERLVSHNEHFDTIIVDLPDPSHPDLSKLYSDYFYSRLKTLLSGDGAIAVQSTSPYHARKAFISIGKTLDSAGFITEQYHANVPSFGEWGWTIGTVHGKSASERIRAESVMPVADSWLSKELMLSAFVFARNYYQGKAEIEVNRLGSRMVYRYHHEAWQREDGTFFSSPAKEGPGKKDVAKRHIMAYPVSRLP